MGPSRQFANHPDPMDLWLDTQGYYRKVTARDGSSLFRSIAEQVLSTQRYHPEVRKQCVEYLTSHPELLQEAEMEESVDVYLEHLQCPTQWGGPVEITAMSQLYKVNILVFKEVGVHPQLGKSDVHEKTLMLCTSQDHHYDPVYPKEYTKVAGFCQCSESAPSEAGDYHHETSSVSYAKEISSAGVPGATHINEKIQDFVCSSKLKYVTYNTVCRPGIERTSDLVTFASSFGGNPYATALVYEVLYQNVFMMKDVDYAVDKMLHYKPLRHRNDLGACSPRKFYSFNSTLQFQRKGAVEELLDAEINVRELLSKGITPFPYKVAKSLDPNIFRNVEFDVWIDYRRGLRLGYFGSNNELRVGVKCLVKLNDENSYVGHIQEMAAEKGPVVLFVEEFGEKRTVPYECLEVLPQEQPTTKQWPATFQNQRFNSSSSSSKQASLSESGNKPRKGRDSGDQKSSGPNAKGSQGGARTRNRKTSQSNSNFECSDMNNVTTSQSGLGMIAYAAAPSEAYIPYQGYQVEAEMGIPVMVDRSMQYPLLPPTPVSPIPGHAPLLLPISPTPDDMAYRYAPFAFPQENKESGLGGNGSMNPTDYFQFVSDSPAQLLDVSGHTTADEIPSSKDCSANYSNEIPKTQLQINFKAPKSVLDNGADLPMSDIQTLRFFYNLGNDIYQAQCCAWNSGSYPVSVCNAGCAPACGTVNSQSACAGKCACTSPTENPMPVQDSSVTTSTSFGMRRKRRDTTVSSPGGVSMSSESDAGDLAAHGSRGNPLQGAVQPPQLPPRLKKDGKPGKSKSKENKCDEGGGSRPNAAQTSASLSSKRTADRSAHLEPLVMGDIPSKDSGEAVVPAMALPCGYVCYPNSPVLPYSPVDSETGMPFFPSCRVQYSDYMTDSRQQPFSPLADVSAYANSAQYPLYAPSSHIFFPASPGIYVGAAPSWTTMAPPTPQ